MQGADYAGLLLEVLTDVAELPTAPDGEPPDLHIVEAATPIAAPSSWAHHWTVGDDDVVLSLGKRQGRHVLRFDDGAVFEFDRNRRTITCPPLDGSARHQLLDHVLPRVLDDLGHLMVHGSAVDTPNGAVVFVGDTGRGKSTLAASFHGSGVDLLSDDCLRLVPRLDGTVSCTPAYRSLRLWPDSANTLMATAQSEPISAGREKRLVRLREGTAPASSGMVAAICVLTAPPDDFCGVQLNELAPSEAITLLLGQCFRLDPTDQGATKGAFERVADVVERLPIIELIYDRSYDRLSEVRDAVLRLSASDGSGSIRST